MLAQSIGIWSVLLVFVSTALAAEGDSVPQRPDQKSRCPHCRSEDSDTAQLLKNADRLYAQFKAKEAADELLKILRVDAQNFEALVKLSRAYIDIGDMIPESAANWRERRLKEYRTAEDYARRAVKVDPNSTWGHFYVGASLGHVAVVSPVARQIELAGEIREAIERSIALDAKNGFAYHALGMWHRKMAEIGNVNRMFASVVYGRSLPAGSLEKAIEYFKKSISLNPTVIVSRFELASIYVAQEDWPAARTLLSSVRTLPIQFSDDAKHKQKAEELLEEIKNR